MPNVVSQNQPIENAKTNIHTNKRDPARTEDPECRTYSQKLTTRFAGKIVVGDFNMFKVGEIVFEINDQRTLYQALKCL